MPTIFIKIVESPPVGREHVHTRRAQTRIDNSVFKKI